MWMDLPSISSKGALYQLSIWMLKRFFASDLGDAPVNIPQEHKWFKWSPHPSPIPLQGNEKECGAEVDNVKNL